VPAAVCVFGRVHVPVPGPPYTLAYLFSLSLSLSLSLKKIDIKEGRNRCGTATSRVHEGFLDLVDVDVKHFPKCALWPLLMLHFG
jgi:hypothetical protein